MCEFSSREEMGQPLAAPMVGQAGETEGPLCESTGAGTLVIESTTLCALNPAQGPQNG